MEGSGKRKFASPWARHGDENAAAEQAAPAPADEENRASEVAAAERVRARHSSSLMSKPGIVGVGITLDEQRRPAIVVYLVNARAGRQVPQELDGVPVITHVTGPLAALSSASLAD
jgi:hypothetical protein